MTECIMSMNINPQLDFFLKLPENMPIAMRYRHRLLVAIVLACLVFLVFSTLWYLCYGNMIGNVKPYYYVALLLIPSYLVLLYGIKRGGNYNLIANVTIVGVCLSILVTIFFAGGPLRSSAIHLLLVPVIMAFMLGGKTYGTLWFCLVLLLSYGMFIAGLYGYEYPVNAGHKEKDILNLVHWSYSIVTIVFLILVYEHLQLTMSSEQEVEKNRFQYLALHDPLTQLANRQLFEENLRMAIARAERQDTRVALFQVDLNDFKPINDTYGHDAGDAVLCHVAANIDATLRKSDLAARVGGDEFVVIFDRIENKNIATLALKLLDAIAQPLDYRNNKLKVGASIGISVYPTDADCGDCLKDHADLAMYEAKKDRLGWKVFDGKKNAGCIGMLHSHRKKTALHHRVSHA